MSFIEVKLPSILMKTVRIQMLNNLNMSLLNFHASAYSYIDSQHRRKLTTMKIGWNQEATELKRRRNHN